MAEVVSAIPRVAPRMPGIPRIAPRMASSFANKPFCLFALSHTCYSEGEKPPKIRKKSSQEQSSWELLALLPLKRQRKEAKSREHWSEKFLGTEFVFFLVRFFCPLVMC